VEEYIPNIRSIVDHRQVLTPLDLERRFGITGGNIFHGEMSLDQMFSMRPGGRLGPLPDAYSRPLSVRLRRAPRRRRDGRAGI
jgi:phytoene dehydrogenase-like protein